MQKKLIFRIHVNSFFHPLFTNNLFYTIFMFRVVRRALERSSQLRNKYTVGNFQIWLTFLLIKALLAYTYETMLNKINFPFIRVFFPQICQVAFVKKKFFLKKIWNWELKWRYSPFHKTLPKSNLQMLWISVRFYEMGDRKAQDKSKK